MSNGTPSCAPGRMWPWVATTRNSKSSCTKPFSFGTEKFPSTPLASLPGSFVSRSRVERVVSFRNATGFFRLASSSAQVNMSGSVPPPQWLKSTIFTALALVTYASSAYESQSAHSNAPLTTSCQKSTRVSSNASFCFRSVRNG